MRDVILRAEKNFVPVGDAVREVKDIRLGDHLCLAYAHEDEQRQVVTEFVGGALAAGERVVYFTEGVGERRVHGWLSEAGLDVDAAVQRGALGIRSAEDSYLASGRFDPSEMIVALRSEIDASLACGFTGLRMTGEMSWALSPIPGAERLEEYERRATALFEEGHAAAICQYDTRRFPPDQLTTLAACHPGRVHLNAIFQHGPLRVVSALDPDGGLVLRVTGTIDHSNTDGWADVLSWAAGQVGAGGEARIDMSGLEFIDVAGLRVLVRAAACLRPGRVRVRNMAPMLAQVVTLVGWDDAPGLVIDKRPQEVGA
ncbi:MEDS domain-containing protein [Sphaerisporangium fuscum]|uniref:MEDS domain-containing protein n=1 Tax=Sphaerisporangium fuscum TaxID=2835868 RepID=UPI001BDBBEB0|nr:MEDS domain-containing protein [Sphaerisporangium fuscum]